MADDFEVPARLVDVLAKQMYGRTLRRRAWESGWDALNKAQKQTWLDDASAAIEPMYREIADELERRMITSEAISAAVKAFNRAGEKQPIEEAIHAAWAVALPARPRRRTLAEAIKRLARAGQEIGRGFGVGEAADRIGCGEIALRTAGLAPEKTPPMALGVAIGMLMAGDSEAEAALDEIYSDWTAEQTLPEVVG